MTSEQGNQAHFLRDPGAWRAVAHPLRLRLLRELARFDRARAADLAEATGEPANSVSFHLRQLARYGLIEQVEPADSDRREKWWRLADPDGLRFDSHIATPETFQAARDAIGIERAHTHEFVDTWFAAALNDEDTPEGAADNNDEFMNFQLYFDLDRGDWKQLKQELKTVLDRWRERSAPAPDRHTYQLVGFGANRQDLDDVRAAAKKRRSDR